MGAVTLSSITQKEEKFYFKYVTAWTPVDISQKKRKLVYQYLHTTATTIQTSLVELTDQIAVRFPSPAPIMIEALTVWLTPFVMLFV